MLSFKESNQSEGISLYIHLPFCESLCTFCACHKHITKRHEVEPDYIDAVIKEWSLYLDLFDQKPIIKELHLGGGTPTFFSPGNLKKLIEAIFEKSEIHPQKDFSFEGHPSNTTREHLETLYALGFDRVSFGVQDYNLKVQKSINRIQTFEQVKKVTELAREVGYKSVSHDLIFGLPFQEKKHIIHTIEKTKELKPDRIAFYSYAHVPWIKGVGQRGFSDSDLPKETQKREFYSYGKTTFDSMGYKEIGMDHFATPQDSLCKAIDNKNLHRNFMGYTANKTKLMVGLGMSAIGDSWYGFGQNVKSNKEYYACLNKNEFPLLRGHILNKEDLIIRKHILNMMCHFETSWQDNGMKFELLQICLERLKPLIDDKLVFVSENGLKIPEVARPFVRNICMAFDLHLHKSTPSKKLFSMTI